MANPFQMGLQTLGQVGGLMQQKQQYDIRQQELQQQEQAQLRQQQMAEEFEAIAASGNPVEFAKFSMRYPEVGKQALQSFGITNQASMQQARRGYAGVVSAQTPEQAITALQNAIPEVVAAGGRPQNMQKDLQLLQEQGEAALNQVKSGALLADSTLLDAYRAQSGGRAQFGATDMLKDEQGNLFYTTQKRDPQTGQVETVYSSITPNVTAPQGRVEVVGQYGQTAQEKAQQAQSESSQRERGKIEEKARQSFIESGVTARGMIGKTEKMLELNEAINTGKISKATKFMSDVFGVTDPDVGQFNALAGNLILDNIRMLGANPTEGERAFLERITPSLEQGGAVNEAILRDMLDLQKRQVERGKWFARNPDKTVSDYLLEYGEFESNSNVDTQPMQGEQQAPMGQMQQQQAPQAALDFLRQNPNQIDSFVQKYGYRPEGF